MENCVLYRFIKIAAFYGRGGFLKKLRFIGDKSLLFLYKNAFGLQARFTAPCKRRIKYCGHSRMYRITQSQHKPVCESG